MDANSDAACNFHGTVMTGDMCNCRNEYAGKYCDQCSDSNLVYPECKSESTTNYD